MKRQGAGWALVLLAVMLGCAARAPRKPAGVPPESFWVGTRHSGVFVIIGAKEREAWRIRIFDDRSGAVRAEGPFILRGIARADIDAEDIASFDGTNLHLTDGALLVPKVVR